MPRLRSRSRDGRVARMQPPGWRGGSPGPRRAAHRCRGSASRERNHGVGDHPIPFRTRQLSSPSSMILRILTWESRTTPRHYFQRAVLYRTALCFLPEAHPHRGHPSLSPGPAQALPAVSPPSLGSPPPSSFCFLRLYAPVRSIIGVSFSPLPFSRKPYRFARQRPRKTSE